MSDLETMKAYARQAKKYSECFSRDKPDQDLQDFMDGLVPSAKVLDLGCGPGNSAAMMRDAGFDVDALDASPEMAEIGRQKYGIDIQVGRFDQLEAIDLYDGIWVNFSLLHAPHEQVPAHLAKIKRAMRKGGLLHIGLKIGQGSKRDQLGRMYYFHSVEGVQNMLREAGFDVVFTREGAAKGLAGTKDPFMIIRAHG